MKKFLKKHFFDFATVCFAFILLFFNLYQVVYPYFYMPKGRVATFLEGNNDDYTGYVSYIKEGMYGRNFVAIRSVPDRFQKPTVIHIFYIFLGKVGRLTGQDAPVVYHLSRFVLGFIFVLTVYRFCTHMFRGSKKKAFLTTVLAFLGASLSWYSLSDGKLIYHTQGGMSFYANLTLRVSGRPHYEAGAIILLILFNILFFWKKSFRVKAILGVFLAFLMGIIHTTIAFLMVFTLCLMLLIKVIIGKANKNGVLLFLLIIIGALVGLYLSYIGTKQPPWNLVYVVKSEFSFEVIKEMFIYLGPIMWIGIPGLVAGIIMKNRNREVFLMCLLWIISQFSFFFYLYKYLNSDPSRFIQSVYFIPLAVGTAYIFDILARVYGKWLFYIGMVLVILLSVPRYIYDFQKSLLYRMDSYDGYTTLVFPAENYVKAYRFLDSNTPKESMVLAGYEAGNNIIMYSHNFVLGNRQGWSFDGANIMEGERNNFFLGYISKDEMKAYLKKYGIEYIYGGYQEKRTDLLDRYTDLFTRVYSNPEVDLYKVNK